MVIAWNTGLAAERARFNLKLKKKKRKKPQAPSSKRQAPSLTSTNNRIIRDKRLGLFPGPISKVNPMAYDLLDLGTVTDVKILSECASRDPEPSGKQGSKRQDTNHIGALAQPEVKK